MKETVEETIQRLRHQAEDRARKKEQILQIKKKAVEERKDIAKDMLELRSIAAIVAAENRVPRKHYSPSLREKRWVSIAVRALTYAKIRELSQYHNKAIGDTLGMIVDQAFEKALQESNS